jgi:hypothetical protein
MPKLLSYVKREAIPSLIKEPISDLDTYINLRPLLLNTWLQLTLLNN